ncbi:Serine acetyltransferase [Hahella chejuensis KCTC 2396]|uniref:Serine acetyltransferase n=1 Tax=Hahella chejuensis (strain KCTC 2396) TaxID=349521 RepID=Q2S969_HAHCH|nr:serine acetyltransferase [Hahella chejuensis]ABC32805.1 Serine acetyltransferase [Hahella chejuensis KCTC 2396]
MITNIKQDVRRKAELLYGDASTANCLRALPHRGTLAAMVYRFGRQAGDVKFKPLSLLLKAAYFVLFYLVQMFTGVSIQSYARIGKGMVVCNFSGIFVLAEEIGDNFTVYEGVTVGNIRGKPRLAIIGDNVTLEPGCKVLGDVTIGDNVVVRANSLVITDVPANSIAIGNPARIVPMKTEEKVEEPKERMAQHG